MTAEQREKIDRVRHGRADLFTEIETFNAEMEAFNRLKVNAAWLADNGTPDDARAAKAKVVMHGGCAFVRAQSIIARCKAYAADFHGGDLAAGLADLQTVCDWMAEQGQADERRAPLPTDAAGLADLVRVLACHVAHGTDADAPTYRGYFPPPDVQSAYAAAIEHERLWRAKLSSLSEARK